MPPSGVLSSAKNASRDKGEAMALEVAELIAAAVRKEFSLGIETPERRKAAS